MTTADNRSGVDLQMKVGSSTVGDLLTRVAKPKSSTQKEEILQSFEELVLEIVGGVKVVPRNVQRTIRAAIAAIDAKLTAQVNEIMHSPEFQKLESAWRGLHHLCKNTPTDETLRIRVLNVSRDELYKSLERFEGDAEWDKSPLYNKLHRDTFSMPGVKGDAAPFGALIGDFYFSHSYEDTQMLRWISQVCASCHCPFIAGAAPGVMGLDSWTELQSVDNVTMKLSTKEHGAWNDLRKSEDARYLCLTMPRFLARMPYGKKGLTASGFSFEENAEGAHHDRFVWANAAYALGVNITRAYKESAWPVQIRGKEGGGEVVNLPLFAFETADGDTDIKCPTECAFDQRREAELSANGFMGLQWWPGETSAAFVGGQTLKAPAVFSTSEANRNEQLGARLPYILAASRFSHYLKKMVYDKIGKTRSAGEDWSSADGVQRTLQDWINMYVCANPSMASDEQLAEKPLAAAEVRVKEDPDNPGMYAAEFFIRPHYQFEGLDVTMSLVADLPKSNK